MCQKNDPEIVKMKTDLANYIRDYQITLKSTTSLEPGLVGG